MYKETRNYYSVAGISAEDVIDGMNMLHREGAALKYLFRCNNVLAKGERLEDLKKCRHYLSRCLQHTPPPFRENNADFYIPSINPSVFNSNIYDAICEIIYGVGSATSNYKACFRAALDYVTDAIEEY